MVHSRQPSANAFASHTVVLMPTPSLYITANELRALAERADSHRGVVTYLVRNPEEADVLYDVVEDPGNREVVMRLVTENEPTFVTRAQDFRLASTPTVHMVKFPEKGIEYADAVFTSLVAMDKFVVPYYARHSSPTQIAEMRDRFARDPSMLAICHIPDSIETGLRADGEHDFKFKADEGLHAVVYAANQEANPGTVSLPLKAYLSMPFR